MFKYHLCIIIILYKRERCARQKRDAWGLVACARARHHKRFFFSYLFLSPKYILLINHFSLHLFMQNSYSDNRCCGVSYPTLCAVACACTRAIPEPMLYTNFLLLIAAFLSTYLFVLRSAALSCALIYALILPSLYHRFTTIRISVS